MKLASFDIEIATSIPDGCTDWHGIPNLGISCAAVALSDTSDVGFWWGEPRMTREQCQQMVVDLDQLVKDGYTLLTWNGCGFDFRVLANESGMYRACSDLAYNHIDMMLMVTFSMGHYLGLQKALDGAGLKGKLKYVTLSDGTVISDMNGAKAPDLWAAGEQKAVLQYLADDVLQPLELARIIQEKRVIEWRSASGNIQSARFDKLLTVRECFDLPEPDTSWMSSAPTREQFIEWFVQGGAYELLTTE